MARMKDKLGLYQCPYDKAIKCDMSEPCPGCEDFAPNAIEEKSNNHQQAIGEIAFLEQLKEVYFKIKCDTYQSVGYKLLNDRIAQLHQ